MKLIGLFFDNYKLLNKNKTLFVRSSRLSHTLPIIEKLKNHLEHDLYVLSNTANGIQNIVSDANIILYDENIISDINKDTIRLLKQHKFTQIIYTGWEYPYFASVQFGNIYDFLYETFSSKKKIPIYYVDMFYSLFQTKRLIEMPFPENLFPQLSNDDALLMYKAAKKLPENSKVVEIGSCCGGSLAVMGLASKKSVQLFSIDPKHHDEFYRIMVNCDLLSKVTPLTMLSCDASLLWKRMHKKSKRKIGLLFIDGDHSYEGCKYDIVAWKEYVKPGGWIILHDYCKGFPGVIRACEEELLHNKDYTKKAVTNGAIYFKKIN